ncbi:M23 family metallopeptidase [Alteromonas facilis]|uniref:M23 family metallopeptidase n=1 Tax=Alteromonas facilis TaxID=2048004 RepID=UPI000C28F95F|nr:M23 family metallopeptidase [Alteromonas facilis]
MRKLTSLGLLILSIVFTLESDAATCFDDWFCFDKQQNPAQLYLYNITPYPVVVTVTGAYRDTSWRRHRFEKTYALRANSKETVLSFQPEAQSNLSRLQYSVSWSAGQLNAVHDHTVEYLIPFAKGQRYTITQGMGGGFSHTGASRYAIDFAVPVGTPVHAARNGIVIDTVDKHYRQGETRAYAKYANYIVILHDDGTTGEYHHLKQYGVAVQRGDSVDAGQLIGFSGNTGFSSLPHLHFAVYRPKPNGNFESIPFKFVRETHVN